MLLAEKGVRGKGRQPLSPPSAGETRSARSAPLHQREVAVKRIFSQMETRRLLAPLRGIIEKLI